MAHRSRRLEAMLLVADTRVMYLVSRHRRSHQPDDGVIELDRAARGNGRRVSCCSALDARGIAEQAMAIAADICVYTNSRVTLEELS
jgi:ATP-dependent HslUV protease subunit HslV